MKAWRVSNGEEWDSLVVAPTKSEAKAAWLKEWANETDAVLADVKAVRYTPLDGLYDNIRVIDSPHDLPNGVVFWKKE